MVQGIDVSTHNGVIDWAKVKSFGGVQFAMIRSSYGWDNPKQIDKQLINNVSGCEAVGIPYGFYHYSYAETTEDAIKEANFCWNAIKNYNPTYPICFDVEEIKIVNKLNSNQLCDICKAFLSTIESFGGYAMVYSSAAIVTNKLTNLNEYDLWVANWDVAKPNVNRKYGIWQFHNKGSIVGINGDVDMDYAYKDYPTIISNMKSKNNSQVNQDSNTLNDKSDFNQEVIIDLKNQITDIAAKYKTVEDKYNSLVEGIEDLYLKCKND